MFKVLCFITATVVAATATPIPQSLTEDDFRSFAGSGSVGAPSNIAIVSGYSGIRRQGKMIGGDSYNFKRPLTVKNPFQFAASASRARLLSSAQANKIQRIRVAPVFNIDDMLKKEAAKLKAKIHEASLEAARLAKETEKEIEEIFETASSPSETVEEHAEQAAETTEKIAETIIVKKVEQTTTVAPVTASSTTTEELKSSPTAVLIELGDETKKNQQPPSSEIDLGFVQEV